MEIKNFAEHKSNATCKVIWPHKATNNSFVPTMPPGQPANVLIASIDAVATRSLLQTMTKRKTRKSL